MSDSNYLTKALEKTVLSRRSFLKWSAALGGTAAISGGLDYGLKAATHIAEKAAAEEGKWMMASCWHNCGGRCPNLALVKDGVVVRQKTDDSHPDSPDFPQQRGCARGRSQRHQVFGPDRIKYPMKRKNWEPGGGKRELRGKDEWVRISWEEALDICASELKRVKEKYGNEALFTPRHESRLVNSYGGAYSSWGVTSQGAWPQVTRIMSGGTGGDKNDRLDYRNSKLIVFWGSNPAVSSGGNPAYNFLQAKKNGAKIIFVDPQYNDSAQALADDWVPVRPSTDTALLLAIAHYMITNDLQDQEFLDKYTVGFDAEHMPEGADPQENFKDYVLGTYDGQAKSPEWASRICGTHPRKIRQFAHEIATTKPMAFLGGWVPARTYLGETFCQAFFTVGWMTGNVGISGGMVTESCHNSASYGGPRLVSYGGSGQPGIANPLGGGVSLGYAFGNPENTEFKGFAYEEMWDAVNKGEWTATVRGKQPCDIKLMWLVRAGTGANSLNQVSGINKGIEAFRKVEFVASNDIVLSTISKYADVVLPATSMWEKEYGNFIRGNPEMIIYSSQITPPLYEARDEAWMERELASRLGIDPDEVHPVSHKLQIFNQMYGSTVIKEDGSGYEPLVTFTEEDIAEWGAEAEPQQGVISMQEFMERGIYQVPRAEGDNFEHIGAKAFRDDPDANPLNTASGKLEIHCQPLADKIVAYGFDTLAPIAEYRVQVEGIEDAYADWDNRVRGEYPLQLFTQHSYRRSHSVFDNIPQLREAFPQEFIMNPIDAQARGLKQGDTVLVRSQHGKVLRPLVISSRIMPGVVNLMEGAWVEKDDESGIDMAGATNSLEGARGTGQGQEPWSTCIVQVEKWNGDPVPPDKTWPRRIPIKEV